MTNHKIQKIEIKNFGLFKNYSWNESIGGSKYFHKLNLIYGRNYSGKTTLSRIFKSLEDKKVNPDFEDCDFSLSFSNNLVVTKENLLDLPDNIKVRVYNSDYVREHLSWFYQPDGKIAPFTVLGSKNVELEAAIADIESKLGSVENKTGLLYELSLKELTNDEKQKEFDNKQNSLRTLLQNKAREIKNNANIFNHSTYIINSIEADILAVKETSVLADEDLIQKRSLLKEEAKTAILKVTEKQPNFESYINTCEELLSRRIQMTNPIMELVNDALLQRWVRDGISLHKGLKDTCGFCNNPIDSTLWDKLNSHFNTEFEQLKKEIEEEIIILEKARNGIQNFMNLNKQMFYSTFTKEFEELQKIWNKKVNEYSENIEKLLILLNSRLNDIFKTYSIEGVSDISHEILDLLKEFNLLIEKNNSETLTLSAKQKQASYDLRISEVAKFIQDINYKDLQQGIKETEEDNKEHKKIFFEYQSLVKKLLEEKRVLHANSQDESKGAELVNQLLEHFFGHSELKLISEGVSPKIKFKVTRDGKPAKNLSEGECSLISFCYFIAKIKDEIEARSATESDLIIYIDDPISSLDSNHIFFIFSLIESVITAPKKYLQLFISTHNLNFLKYLKMLTVAKEPLLPNTKTILSVNHFLIERFGKNQTRLVLAPDYIKEYITEFNYLFKQIYKCANIEDQTLTSEYQYNFGNNMRKFLEAYLFYKYPSHKLNLIARLNLFFDNDKISVNLVNRVIQEYSHLQEKFDRGLEPIDINEIGKVANKVLERINTIDPHQYTALLQSIAEETISQE